MKKRYLILLLTALLPAILLLIHLGLMSLGGANIRLVPSVYDEMFWFHQVGAMVRSGSPLGYYGYNGAHAQYGTFGPWGIVILLPYAAFGKLFGWHLFSMSVANVVFLGCALLVFCLMCELSVKEICLTAAVYATLLLNIKYSVSNMAEALRWSMAIVLAGTMIRLWRGRFGFFAKWIGLPVLLVFCTEAYLLLGLFVPVYFMIVLPEESFIKRTLMSVCFSLPVLWVLNRILRLFTSGYSKYAGISWIDRINKDTHIVLSCINPFSIWKMRRTSYGFTSLYLLFFDLLCIFVLIMLCREAFRQVRGRKKEGMGIPWYRNRELMRYLLLSYLAAGIFAGYCLFYERPSVSTVIRGFHVVTICALMVLSLCEKKRLLAAAVGIMLILFPSYEKGCIDSLNTRYLTDQQMLLMEKTKEEFSSLFDLSPEYTAWENTIAHYGTRKSGAPTAITLAMPEVAGYNVMLEAGIVCEAKYAVVYNSFSDPDEYGQIIENLKQNGYHRIWKYKKKMTLLMR